MFQCRMTPEQREAVVRDYKAKKYKTGAELAKSHGVSKSAVYRLVKSLDEQPKESEERKEQQAQGIDRGVPDDFYKKMDKFANDLGLPMDGSQLRHNVEHKTQEELEEQEREIEAAFSRIAGDIESPAIDDSLLTNIYGEPPPKRQEIKEQPRESRPPIIREQPAFALDTIQRIIFNVEHFKAHLSTIIGDTPEQQKAFIQSLNMRDPMELKSLLTTIERTRSVGNITAGFKQVFFMTSQAVEAGTRMIGMKTEGFLYELRAQDEEITMCLKEIAINEWERLKSFDAPHIRLGMLFSMTLLQTDTRNRMNDQLKRVVEAPVNPDVMAQNEDL